jgi:hypothetical protein
LAKDLFKFDEDPLLFTPVPKFGECCTIGKVEVIGPTLVVALRPTSRPPGSVVIGEMYGVILWHRSTSTATVPE